MSDEIRNDPLGLIDETRQAYMTAIWNAIEDLSLKHYGCRIPFACVVGVDRDNTCMASNLPEGPAYGLMMKHVSPAEYTASSIRHVEPRS